MDGFENATENIDIQYTYHEHTGTSSTKGGCYTVDVACGGTKDLKLNSPSCYNGRSWGNCHTSSGYVCSTHGCYYDSSKGQMNCKCPGHYECKSCGAVHDSLYGICNVTRSYTVGCGKTTDTIESATIIFN